ncbi:sigma 54-interacting transcriptional regulator [Pseudogracilibacillus sp. ICA-222130]|uniref:sigma 54-interacting transcriptional regulator n=1 Tax=Pseudogracilibacillus sp. ICA-222130 TaxID=3134655 RepID=UPI0030BBA03D
MERLWETYSNMYVDIDHTVEKAGEIMLSNHVQYVPVLNEGEPVGYITMHTVLQKLMNETAKEQKVSESMRTDFLAVFTTANMDEMIELSTEFIIVVHPDGTYAGMMTQKEIQPFIHQQLETKQQTSHITSILDVILETAYEGIAVVDEAGILIELNESYAKFIGVHREDAIGKHVTEVIDNTKLHKTVKNAIPERNVLQHIQGQDMIVHRIPIWQGDKVIGAIGMLIFEGVSEVYHIYRKLQTEKENMLEQVRKTATTPDEEYITMDKIVGTSEEAVHIKQQIRKAAQTKTTVLMTGEKGTGKEMFARTIHQLSPNNEAPFYRIHCKTDTPSSIEKRLFGLEDEPGLLAMDVGTIYLEYFEYLPKELQDKLFYILKRKEYKHPITNEKEPLRIRIIASSTKIATWSDDKLNLPVIHIPISPLRTRKKDMTFLLSHYLQEYCYIHQKPQKSFSSDAVHALLEYDWPGNVEELIQVVENLVTTVQTKEIDVHHLPIYMQVEQPTTQPSWLMEIKHRKKAEERKMILTALEEAGGNKTKAANILGMHRTTLYKKIKELEIEGV